VQASETGHGTSASEKSKRHTRRQRLTAEEQQLIALLEKDYGRPMTDQEIRLSLEQARPLGEI